MAGYFPKGGGWPAIAKTTPGVIRGTVYKQLDRYVPTMNESILKQLSTLDFQGGQGEIVFYILKVGGASIDIDRLPRQLL